MAETEDNRVALAATAEIEALQAYVHDSSSRVLKSLLQNRNITEQEVLIIANRKNVTGEVLEMIAKDNRWSKSYPVRLALVRNPRSALFISLSLARFIRIFDLEEMTRSPYIPVVLRWKIEAMLVERIPTMPLGNKKTLAKKAAGKVLLKLLQERIPQVVQLCLGNPHLVEAHLYTVISRAQTPAETILMIAEHPAWSRRPPVRFSLTRNTHMPLSLSVRFLKSMKLVELRELYIDRSLPVMVKPLVYRELLNRGIDPGKAGEYEVYEIAADGAKEQGGYMSINDEHRPDNEKMTGGDQ